MKKMFIVLTSALLVGSGLYSMEKDVTVPATTTAVQDAEYGQAIVRYSTWDLSTGLLTVRDSEGVQGHVYTRDNERWFDGDVRNQAAGARVAEDVVGGLNRLVAAIEQDKAAPATPIEVIQTMPQPEKQKETFELKRDGNGDVRVGQIARFGDKIFTVVATKGTIVWGQVRTLGSDACEFVQAHPYRTGAAVVVFACETASGAAAYNAAQTAVYYISATVIPAVITVGPEAARFVASHASHAARLAKDHTVSTVGHVGRIGQAGARKLRKSTENCSVQ